MNSGWTYTDRIRAASAGQTVLAYYSQHYPHSSPATWRDRILTGQIRLNEAPTQPDTLLQAGQVLRYDRPPWVEPEVPLDFSLCYDDEDLIVVDKPAGLPVLPGGGFLEHTLLWQLQQRYPERPPQPIHRLGRGTSGLLIAARSPLAKTALTQQMRDRQIEKIYLALAQGLPPWDHQHLTTPIGKHPHPVLGNVYGASMQGLEAHSEAWVIERRVQGLGSGEQRLVSPEEGKHNRDPIDDGCGETGLAETLLAVQIFTGRPHQIRIQLAAAGFPLVGDPLYGPGGQLLVPQDAGCEDAVPVPGDCGYWLHAHRVGFVHPRTGKAIAVISPAPTRLNQTIA